MVYRDTSQCVRVIFERLSMYRSGELFMGQDILLGHFYWTGLGFEGGLPTNQPPGCEDTVQTIFPFWNNLPDNSPFQFASSKSFHH